MEPFVRRALRLAELLQTQMPATARPGAAYPAHLSEQEVTVVRQIAQGRTDREMADDLVLSSTTVARHMRSLFTKIGVKSRTAAAAYAFEQGLVAQLPPERGTTTASALDHAVGTGKALRTTASLSPTQPLRIILVTDIEGSTALIQRWGDVQAYELLGLHNAIIRDCLRQHHGTEVAHTGDGIEAAFLSASNAIECAIAIQQAFATHNHEHSDRLIRVRIGLNAGEPIATENRLFGTAVHTAFRICARAQPGQILVSEVIRQLVAGKDFALTDRGRVALKGLPGRVRLYEVCWEGERE
jgi:class 3 adenylate cyclase/DNA-binding CsgD family transcriptional regulator